MNRTIKKIAVLGSGIMGSRIACHFANIGVEVLLLDIANKESNPDDNQNKLNQRNRNIEANFQKTIQTKPSPTYLPEFNKFIKLGNFEDDIQKIEDCDWVLEAVIEDLLIKNELFKAVEKYRKKGTLVTTNTSSIAINLMLTGRSNDFKSHFCGTHFFNPPRYLPLLEIIPTTFTKPNVTTFLVQYGENFLGKNVILCKNTPAFIANRIGVFSILDLWHTADSMNLNIAEVDAISGLLWGRPKSATFRLCDLVGLDTLAKIADYLQKNLKSDESISTFKLPKYIKKMIENNLRGNKTNQGFYKKIKTENGKTEVLTLNLKTFGYEKQQEIKWDNLQDLKKIEDLEKRFKTFYKTEGKAGDFFRTTFANLFAYCANRIPEITNDLYQIDDAMRAGFGWQFGPFEIWDLLSFNTGLDMIKQNEKTISPWVLKMQKSKNQTFYKTINHLNYFYCPTSDTYKIIPNRAKIIDLDNLRTNQTVYKNPATTLINLGDGILNLEFKTKLNTIDTDVLIGINEAISLAESQYKGLVIANQAANFSVGANLNNILKMAQQQDWDGLNAFINLFQQTTRRIKYANIPVVIATQGLVLGGAAELCLHATFVQLHAETYMGLVECGVGLLPAGGGCKQFSNLNDNYLKNQVEHFNMLKNRFLTIAASKVSTSALEAVGMGFLKAAHYAISLNKKTLIFDAKQKALQLSKSFTPALPCPVKVLGNPALAAFYVHINNQKEAGFISEYNEIIAKKLAYVLCGGKLSAPALVSEQYLLDLERETFLSLCADEKTQTMIANIVSKPIN